MRESLYLRLSGAEVGGERCGAVGRGLVLLAREVEVFLKGSEFAVEDVGLSGALLSGAVGG